MMRLKISCSVPIVPSAEHPYSRRHLRIGWWSLLGFIALGITLEALHGFKVGWYLDGRHETRRLMWTLAHAHGTLFSLVHIAFGVTAHVMDIPRSRAMNLASVALSLAIILVPLGFFLGGLWAHAGDPGPGILLVPIGAPLLVAAVVVVASRCTWPK
jgi:hypothetical protein